MVIRIFFFILIIFSASNDCIQRGSRLIELKTEIGTIPWNSVIDRDAAFGEGTIQCTGVNRDQDTREKKGAEASKRAGGRAFYVGFRLGQPII